jgi:predicted amidohydrolase
MRAGLITLCASDDPGANLPVTRDLVREAAAGGAGLVLTPEVTNCVSASRERQQAVLRSEDDDPTLAALRDEARALGIWLLIGSLALKTEDRDGRFANRSFLIGPDGGIAARYDKIHMFDVEVSETETYRESAGYRPGDRAVVVPTPLATLGLSICYDLRFPHLYRALAKAGAQVLTVPSAFSPVTGAAHWEVLLRARAIETGCFVLAPAQTGTHSAAEGRQRSTWGHSLAVDPWGAVLVDGGTAPGVSFADLDLSMVAEARRRVPSLSHDRPFRGPGAA